MNNSIKLPCYELMCDDVETFVNAIAFVESPAIEKDFFAFTNQKKIDFSFNEERMECLGAIMIPDQKIYRRNDKGFEYNVFFSRETIRKIAQAFSKNSYQSNLNIEHSGKSADSFMYQSMIVDRSMGIVPMDLPDGSWVAVMKVVNPAIWKDIKDGKHKGFSIQGEFELIQRSFKQELTDEQEVMSLVLQIQKKINEHI